MIIAASVGPNNYPVPKGGQHITLIYLGDGEADDQIPEALIDQVSALCESVAQTTPQFEVHPERAEELGNADVLFLPGGQLGLLRLPFLNDSLVVGLMNSTYQYPEFTPHMSLCYHDDGKLDTDMIPLAEPLLVTGLEVWHGTTVDSFPFTGLDEVVTAAIGDWNPSLHPRGKDGKFIRKFGIIKFLDSLTGMWSYGQVVGMDYHPGSHTQIDVTVQPSDLSGKALSKPTLDLTPSKIYEAPKAKAKLDVSAMKKVGPQAGSNPGGLYEVPKAAPADNAAGDTGTATPATVKIATESFTAFSMAEMKGSVHVGDRVDLESDDDGETVSIESGVVVGLDYPYITAKLDDGTTVTSDYWHWRASTAPLPTPEPAVAVLDGGTEKFYVKKAKTASHGKNEALANALYEEAGVYVPEVSYNEDDGNIYSKIVPGEHDMAAHLASKDKVWLEKVQANFAVDAWLSNRDVFGLTFDNLLSDENGEPVRIDNGGALLYRAMGAAKTDFNSKVTELDMFREGKKSAVFGHDVMGEAAELDGVQRVLAISPERIEELVAEHGLPKSLADTLKARRKYIADYYSLPLPETVQPAGAENITVAPLVDPLDISQGNGMPRAWTKAFPNAFQFAALAEPGDLIRTAQGVHTLGRVNGFVGKSINDQLAALQAEGGPFQLKKPKIGPRPEHLSTISTVPSSAVQLLKFEWQRGDRIEVGSGVLDVIGVNRTAGTLLVSDTTSPDTFQLNVFHLPGYSVGIQRWDPDAASDTLPAPSVKTGMAVEVETALKADLVEPLPHGGPPAPAKAVGKSGDGIGQPDKTNVKSMVLGDGTTAETGDKVMSKFGNAEYLFVKPKGPYAVVTDPNGDDPNKLLLKKSNTLFQPDKAPAAPDADAVAVIEMPKTKDGTVPTVGMVAEAKDGKSGPITMVSPDGKFVFIDWGGPKPTRKSTGAVTIIDKVQAPDLAAVDPGTASPGTPGLPGHTYGIAKYDAALAGQYPSLALDLLTPEMLVWTADESGTLHVEPWANQPTASLLVHMPGSHVVLFSAQLSDLPVSFTVDSLPPLHSTDDVTLQYKILYAGQGYIANPKDKTPEGIYAISDEGDTFLIPADATVLAYAAADEPDAAVDIPNSVTLDVQDIDLSGEEAKTLDQLFANGLSTGDMLSTDGEHWYTVSYVSAVGAFVDLKAEDDTSFAVYRQSPATFVFKSKGFTSVADPWAADLPPNPLDAVDTPDAQPKKAMISDLEDWSVAVPPVGNGTYLLISGTVYDSGEQKQFPNAKTWGKDKEVTYLGSAKDTWVPVDPYHMQAIALKNVLGSVKVNDKLYNTFGSVSGPDGVRHVLLQDAFSGEWVDGSPDFFAAGTSFKFQDFSSGGAALYPVDSLDLWNSIINGPPPITINQVQNVSSKGLFDKLGDEVVASPAPIYWDSKADVYYRNGPGGKLQTWNQDTEAWDDSQEYVVMPSTFKMVTEGIEQPPVALGDGTLVVPKDRSLAVYSVNLVATSATVYGASKNGPFWFVGSNGHKGAEWAFPADASVTLIQDPWNPNPDASAGDSVPKFHPSGLLEPFEPEPNQKVVEFDFLDGNKAYAVQDSSDGTFNGWDVFGLSTGLPPTMTNASINEALKSNSAVYKAKIVYTGDQYTSPAAAAGTIDLGNFTVPEGSSVYQTSTKSYWIKKPDEDVWSGYTKSGVKLSVTLDAADVAVFEKYFDHISGPKTVFDVGVHGDTFTYIDPTGNAQYYIIDSGDKIITYPTYAGDMHLVQGNGVGSWHLLGSDGVPSLTMDDDSVQEILAGQGKYVIGEPENVPATATPEPSAAAPTPHTLTTKLTVPKDSTLQSYLSPAKVFTEEDGKTAWYLTVKDPVPAGAELYVLSGAKTIGVKMVDGSAYIQQVGKNNGHPQPVSPNMYEYDVVFAPGNEVLLQGLQAPALNTNVPDVPPEPGATFFAPLGSFTAHPGDKVILFKSGTYWIKPAGTSTWNKVGYNGAFHPNSSMNDDLVEDFIDDGKAAVKYPKTVTSPSPSPNQFSTGGEGATPPAVPESIPGVTQADAAAVAAWGGTLTKSGHVPYAGMAVTGKGPMSGKIIGISKDKTKATVLTSDGSKTTCLISALNSNVSANYAQHLGPVLPKEIPEGMEVPYDPPEEVFKKSFGSTGYIGGLLNSHAGVKNAATTVKSATAPNGKTYARVTFTMTTEQRAKFMQYLQADSVQPQKKGAWAPSGSKTISALVPGDIVALRNSSSQSEWVIDKNGTQGTHRLVDIKDNGEYVFEAVTLNGEVPSVGTLITTPFTKKTSSSSGNEFTAKTFAWDPTITPPPLPTSGGFKGLSTHVQALGWEWNSSKYNLPYGDASNGTISAAPENWASSSAIDGVQGGAKLKMADGTVIDVVSPQTKQHSEAGIVVISIPEGGNAVAAYSAAMAALQMEHAPMTQENVKNQVRPLIRNMLTLDIASPDSIQGWTDEQLFAGVSAAVGLPDVGWQDVRVGVHADQGRTEFLWSQRVIDALVAKSPWKNVVRGGNTYEKVFDTARYGTMDATTRRVLGLPGAGNGHGQDSKNNAGHGSFLSGGFASKFATKNLINTNYGGGYSVYHTTASLFARIGDIRPGKGTHDAFGAGAGNGSNAFNGMQNQSESWDLWMAGGLPVDTIGFIVMNNESERQSVNTKLHSAGYTDLNGRPLEEVIQTAAALNASQKPDNLPVYLPKDTVDLLALPA
ncbi:MAG: 2'-5' RNA ligase family protein [Candidatus Nanopelagicales bacterium]